MTDEQKENAQKAQDDLKKKLKDLEDKIRAQDAAKEKVDLEEKLADQKKALEDAETEKEKETAQKAHDDLEKQLKDLEDKIRACLLYTSPSPRDKRQSRMPSSA